METVSRPPGLRAVGRRTAPRVGKGFEPRPLPASPAGLWNNGQDCRPTALPMTSALQELPHWEPGCWCTASIRLCETRIEWDGDHGTRYPE